MEKTSSKILGLHVKNIKRIRVVTIKPNPSDPLVILSGRNGQGKSSALDAIAYALGGASLIPDEPIRHGESKALIQVDLGEFVAERQFTRTRLECDCGQPDGDHRGSCSSHRWTPTKSTVRLRGTPTEEGGPYPVYQSPQAMIDQWIGKIAFDPLDFMSAEPKKQAAILMRIAGLDFRGQDAERAEAFAVRTDVNRRLKIVKERAATVPRYEGIGEETRPVADFHAKLKEARTAESIADVARQSVTEARRALENAESVVKGLEDDVARLEAEIERKRGAVVIAKQSRFASKTALAQAEQFAAEKNALVPDVADLSRELDELTERNVKALANQAARKLDEEAVTLDNQVTQLTAKIEEIDEHKSTSLASASLPVEGLAISESMEPILNGVPLIQASDAERIRVSVAIGLSLNPMLKVLLVRQGSLLDSDGMMALAAAADQAGAQVWVERVSDGAGDGVIIEDGEVVDADLP